MAFAVLAAAGALSGLSKRLRTPSEKRAAKVLPGVVSAALAGNLLAVKVLDERRNGGAHPAGIAKERAVWDKGYNQVLSQRPDLITAYQAARATLPVVDHSSPESAAQSVNSNVGLYTPNPAEQIVQPIAEAVAGSEAQIREGLASAAERIGVGGAAEAARKIRGQDGPLDRLIEFGQKPAGTITLVVGVIVAVVIVARVVR